MDLELLLAQGVPRDAAQLLRESGLKVTHVGELQMSAAPDSEILSFARSRSLVSITRDADFHAMLVLGEALGPSVVRIRIEGLGAGEIARLIQKVVDQFSRELKACCMITVKHRKTTCHLLERFSIP
jgi:predicted nuclease of predicted toxin-antitoxin system